MVTVGRLHHSQYNRELRMDLGQREFIVRRDDPRPAQVKNTTPAKTTRRKKER